MAVRFGPSRDAAVSENSRCTARDRIDGSTIAANSGKLAMQKRRAPQPVGTRRQETAASFGDVDSRLPDEFSGRS